MSIYDQPPIQALARERARRLHVKLFNPTNFAAIMNSLEPTRKQNDFKTACTNAGLAPEETDWLWAYLDKCDKNKWSNKKVRDDPASSGW